MATFYLDPTGGNDANDGTTFANRWKTVTSGATAARIAPGDTVRVMTSADAARVLAPPFSIASSTNASPIEITTSASHGYSTSDVVTIASHATNTAANGTWTITVVDATKFTLNTTTGNGVGGATGTVRRCVNGTFTNSSSTITLSEAVTATIDDCQTAWTASANITTTTSSTRKFGTLSTSITPGASFTTGLMAYRATGTLDLSRYQRVSFWIRGGASIAANVLRLDLCSDAAGATPVHSFTIDSTLASGAWTILTFNTGAALNSAVQSVALTALTDPGTVGVLIDNIIACNETTGGSLLGDSNAAGARFWPLQNLSSTTGIVDMIVSSTPASTLQGYYGTSATTALYYRNCSIITSAQTVQDSGTAGSPITFSFGWDTTDMSTQVGETWLDGRDGTFTFSLNAQNYITLDGYLRLVRGININLIGARNVDGDDLMSVACNTGFSAGSLYNANLTRLSSVCCNNSVSALVGGEVTIEEFDTYSCTNGATFTGSKHYHIDTMTGNNNGDQTINVASCADVFIRSLITNASTNGFAATTTTGGVAVIESTGGAETDIGQAAISNMGGEVRVLRSGGTVGSVSIVRETGTIVTVTDGNRHTASGVAYAMTANSNATVRFPHRLYFQPFAVGADTLVTVTVWMKRTSASLNCRLVILRGGAPGVDSAVVASSNVSNTNSYEEMTLTFTPTEIGACQLVAECYGASATLYVDDFSVSQA